MGIEKTTPTIAVGTNNRTLIESPSNRNTFFQTKKELCKNGKKKVQK